MKSYTYLSPSEVDPNITKLGVCMVIRWRTWGKSRNFSFNLNGQAGVDDISVRITLIHTSPLDMKITEYMEQLVGITHKNVFVRIPKVFAWL